MATRKELGIVDGVVPDLFFFFFFGPLFLEGSSLLWACSNSRLRFSQPFTVSTRWVLAALS